MTPLPLPPCNSDDRPGHIISRLFWFRGAFLSVYATREPCAQVAKELKQLRSVSSMTGRGVGGRVVLVPLAKLQGRSRSWPGRLSGDEVIIEIAMRVFTTRMCGTSLSASCFRKLGLPTLKLAPHKLLAHPPFPSRYQ